jgi:hypothetical protein
MLEGPPLLEFTAGKTFHIFTPSALPGTIRMVMNGPPLWYNLHDHFPRQEFGQTMRQGRKWMVFSTGVFMRMRGTALSRVIEQGGEMRERGLKMKNEGRW